MILGKLPVPGRPTFWIIGQGPIALAVGAGEGCLDIFTLLCLFTTASPSLWETARYRLKYCLKGPLNQKQPTNQPIDHIMKFVMLKTCLWLPAIMIQSSFQHLLEAQGLSGQSRSLKCRNFCRISECIFKVWILTLGEY